MGDRDKTIQVLDVREPGERPEIRALLKKLAHDDEALELVAQLIELLAARSPKS